MPKQNNQNISSPRSFYGVAVALRGHGDMTLGRHPDDFCSDFTLITDLTIEVY